MNKKIKNATPFEYNGINFKSKTEVMAYKTLLEHGFEVAYEPATYVLWEGFKPTFPYYKPNKNKELKLDNTKIINITYTPDFVVSYKNIPVIIEMKGFQNDTYPIKKKMFRKLLETFDIGFFFEIYTKKQLLQAIDIIKKYDTTRENKKSDTVSS